MALVDVHVWLGRFDSAERWSAYLEERYYEDDRGDRPLNQFAADQGETFYDHDAIELIHLDGLQGPVGARAEVLVHQLSYAASFAEQAVADAVAESFARADAVLGIGADEIARPRSVAGDGFELRFVGTYPRSPPMPELDPGATELSLVDQRLAEVPPEVFELTDLITLNLGRNALSSLPGRIEQLQRLEEIHLYGNQLTTLPDELFRLPRLRTVMAQDNSLRSLSAAVGLAAHLESLTVARSNLSSLPDEIGALAQLTLLDVSGNELTGLPATIGGLRHLRTLRIGGQAIVRLPEEITALSISDQLSLPQFFDVQAQSPQVRAWLGERRR